MTTAKKRKTATRTRRQKKPSDPFPWFEDAVRDDPFLRNPQARVALAEQVRTELANSAVARLIIHRAHAEKMAALNDLVTADPADVRAMADIQSRYARANEIGLWIQQAIEDGNAAMERIHESAGDDEIPEE